MIIFLYGEETFQLHRRLAQLQQGFLEKYDDRGLQVFHYTPSTITLDHWRNIVHTRGLFGEKKFIVLQNILSQKGNKDLLDHVRTDLPMLEEQEENILIVVEEVKGLPGSQPLWSALKKGTHVERFDVPSGVALVQWVEEECRTLGVTMESRAIERLISKTGADLWRLSGELAKLASYKTGQKIVAADVEEMVEGEMDESIFALTDALGNKQVDAALRQLEEQLDRGEHPVALLGRLVWQVRTLLLVKAAGLRVSDHRAIAQRIGAHPYVVQKSLRQVEGFSLEQLKQMMHDLSAIDARIKSSQGDPRTLLDLLIVKVCAMR
jgi:DNA polymerase-3 subunit delta